MNEKESVMRIIEASVDSADVRGTIEGLTEEIINETTQLRTSRDEIVTTVGGCVTVLLRMGVSAEEIHNYVTAAAVHLQQQCAGGFCAIGDLSPETGVPVDINPPPHYTITIRFERYRADGEDQIARDRQAKHSLSDLPFDEAYAKQVQSEIEENPLFRDKYSLIKHKLCETVSYVWCEFRWVGEGREFVRALQDTFDEHGMSGDWTILEVFEGPEAALMPVPSPEFRKWCEVI